VKISVALAGTAVVAGLALGCGGAQPVVTANGRESPTPYLPPPTRLDSVFVLEWGGVPPEDTVVRMAKSKRRVILIRRGAPDNSLFARLEVPPAAFSGGPDTVAIAITPRPGRYGVDLEFPADSTTRIELAFSYALAFVAPAGARAAYGSDLEFEKALLIARLDPDGRITFLPTTSPGADIVTATITRPGRYLVAAPRR
jgi:hypothetical protein